jgi:hypothetical protein
MLTVMLVSSFAYAEYYRYTDETGVTRYTDDLSQIPPDQRKNAEEFVSETTPEPEPGVAGQEGQAGIGTETEEDEIDVEEGKDLADLEKMNKKKAELDKEYASLVKEKDDLVKAKESITREYELKAHNEKVVDLNERITAFEKKREAFAKEVEEFNERFKQ